MASMLKRLAPLVTTIPGASIVLLELSDQFDTDPATLFDIGTFSLALVAMIGYGLEKYFKK